MEGERVPLVFFPRFSTFTGEDIEFWSQPVDMLSFNWFSITVYRGKITGTGALAVGFRVQESADLIDWKDVVPSFDPSGAGNVEATIQEPGAIQRRYLRMSVKLGGTNPTITCFAIGWATRTSA